MALFYKLTSEEPKFPQDNLQQIGIGHVMYANHKNLA
jgi:hypothetical protein